MTTLYSGLGLSRTRARVLPAMSSPCKRVATAATAALVRSNVLSATKRALQLPAAMGMIEGSVQPAGDTSGGLSDLAVVIRGLVSRGKLSEDEAASTWTALSAQGVETCEDLFAHVGEVSDRDGIASLSTQLDALAKLGLTLADTIAVMLLKLALKAKRAGPHQDPHTCKNITIFVPDRSARSAYLKREYGKLTPQQLQERLQGDGYRQVLLVDEQPPQLLQLAAAACCGSVKDVEDVVLRDGMRLAVVVNEPVATTLNGWQQGRMAGDESKSAEWARARLAGDKGAICWSYKTVAGIVGGLNVVIQVDGMAYFGRRVALVECQPCITLEHVERLVVKKRSLERLVECGAPNTVVLKDPATGQIKPLEVYLMSDSWVDDVEEVAACIVHMEEHGIEPVLPTWGAYPVANSCGRWHLLDESIRQRGQAFLAKLERQRQSSGVGSHAGAGTGGRAAGPNRAVGIGRQTCQAACSPAPARHLRAHPHSAAAGVQRRVALVCSPATHLSRQHAVSSGPRVCRL